MTRRSAIRPKAITDRFITRICGRLAQNKPVRRSLPIWGRVNIDRQLPFLCVYRRPVRGDDAGTERLVTSEASYLTASATARVRPGLPELVRAIVRTTADQFGAFLLIELWADRGDEEATVPEGTLRKPRFRIFCPKDPEPGEFLDRFEEILSGIRIRGQTAHVEVVEGMRGWPARFAPLLPVSDAAELGCSVLGLQVAPVYRSAAGGEVHPLVLRDLRRTLSRALRRVFHEFATSRTTHRPRHHYVLGRRAVVKAVWEADLRLAAVSNSFDFLLQVTPVNTDRAWRRFRSNRFERDPVFHYRPLPVTPGILKRQLYAPFIERIEDPALLQIFREKQDELDRQITMLSDINTKRFVHGSILLYGAVDGKTLRAAEQLLDRLPSRTRDDSREGHLDAASFAQRARLEIDRYRSVWDGVQSAVHLRNDVPSGLMVSHGSLLVGRQTRIPTTRVEALLQHEIGTHVLTYYNGRAQPFRLLYSGLAGYEPLQEGLAVLAEHLVGGLSRPRMRLLAARVVAVQRLVEGASFVETFRELDRTHDFDQRTAFTITMRVYRGGGFTKDAVYLRGLIDLLGHLKKGGALEPLLVGKVGAQHVAIVEELRWREVLRPTPLRPRYLDAPGTADRLERVRAGITPLELVEGRRR